MDIAENISLCSNAERDVRLIFDGPMSLLVIILGLCGNAYSLRVLYRISMNPSMTVQLASLTAWDIVLLITALCHHSLWQTLHFINWREQGWEPYFSAPLLFLRVQEHLLECAHVSSTWMLIEVTAARFFAVKPFHFASIYRKNKAANYVRGITALIRIPCGMTLIAMALTLPVSIEYSLESCLFDGRPFLQKHRTLRSQESLFWLLYRSVFLSVLKTFGPFAIIAFLTVSTMRTMRKSMKNRASILIEQGKEHLFRSDRDKTKSLQTISMLLLGKFLMLRCWPTAFEMAHVLTHSSASLPTSTSQFLLLLNSATNSLVFIVLKSAFETRRLRRIRLMQQRMVAEHAQAVLNIGKMLASDRLLHTN